MPRESKTQKQVRAQRIADGLRVLYPARCALSHDNPFQLVVATILSAQCTDERVNLVTPVLFARYPTVPAMAEAKQRDVERIIHSTGFFRAKARNIIAASKALMERHGGEIPTSLAELTSLPGVGRKTANVVLGTAFGLAEGVVVDTHVGRLSRRLRLSTHSDPVKVEKDLMSLLPQAEWIEFSHRLIWHGRRICMARNPLCARCPLAPHCPSAHSFLKGKQPTKLKAVPTG